MRAIVILCCLAPSLTGCEEGRQTLPRPSPVSSVASPAPPPPPPPPVPADPPPGSRLIAVGDEVKDAVFDQDRRYAVNLASAGTLSVKLSWADPDGSCYVLRFDIDRREVEGRSYVECRSSCLNHLEWEGKVEAGRQIQIAVVPEGYCWDIGFVSVDFILTTSLG